MRVMGRSGGKKGLGASTNTRMHECGGNARTPAVGQWWVGVSVKSGCWAPRALGRRWWQAVYAFLGAATFLGLGAALGLAAAGFLAGAAFLAAAGCGRGRTGGDRGCVAGWLCGRLQGGYLSGVAEVTTPSKAKSRQGPELLLAAAARRQQEHR